MNGRQIYDWNSSAGLVELNLHSAEIYGERSCLLHSIEAEIGSRPGAEPNPLIRVLMAPGQLSSGRRWRTSCQSRYAFPAPRRTK
jgi:hypothetical protein